MGNKDRRQTKRERKQEAKARRLEEIRRLQRRARVRRVASVVVALAVVAGIGGAVALSSRKNAQALNDLNEMATAAGCSEVQEPKYEGKTHVPATQTVQYGTNPPTSGNHYGQTAFTGVHTTDIVDEQQTHNLEHGHIGISYNDIDAGLRTELEKLVNADPTWMFMEKDEDMPHKLAITAWTRMITCDNPTAAAAEVAKAFSERFKDEGLESLPGTPVGAEGAGDPMAPAGTTSPAASAAPSAQASS